MKVTVVGTGYVGLVTGACLADCGLDVTCADVDERKIAKLHAGQIPIYEPGLEEIVHRNAAAGRLKFTTDVASAMPAAEVIFVAVGTPPLPDGSADLRFVFEVADTFAENRGPMYQVVVNKSTVPVGTGARVEDILLKSNPRESFAVVSNPEFLREGCAVSDFLHPDRIVIGADDPQAREVITRLYKPFIEQDTPLLFTRRVSSELIKYAANAFLATKITFVNEVSLLCEAVGADIQDVTRGMGLDGRIGPRFLQAGPGYGGSCFPKDTRALLDVSAAEKVPMRIVTAVVEANEAQIPRCVDKIREAFGGLHGKSVALLGLAFKSDTDDLRESPAMKIARTLLAEGTTVRAFDPAAMENAERELPGLVFCKDPYDAAEGADGIVIATEWKEFKGLDWGRIRDKLRAPRVVDLRNLQDPESVRERGFTYTSVGRP